jgi:lysophospholipase L1-like esterase
MLKQGHLQKLGLIAVGVFAGLLAGEGLVRVLKLGDSIELNMSKPSAQFELDDNPILKYRTKNPYRFGPYSYDHPKTPEIYRIVILGDSATFGSCRGDGSGNIEPQKTYPALLEKLLNAGRKELNTKFEVANLGVPGYDTISEAEYLRVYGLSLKPDLVIVGYNMNDFCSGNPILLRKLQIFSIFDQWVPALYHASALVRYLWKIANSKTGSCTWDIPKEGLKNINAMSSKFGFKTLVAVIPSFEYDDKYPGDPGYKKILDIAQGTGLDVANLYHYLKSETPNLLSLEGRCLDDHPDEQGHKAIAKAMNDYLTERNLLGSPAH